MTPPSSMLTYPWTAMPWRHYVLDHAAYLANSVVTQHRSFGDNANSQENIGLKVQRVDELALRCTFPLQEASPTTRFRAFETDYIDDIDLPEVLFDPAVSDSFATFHVSMWEDEVGAEPHLPNRRVDNDSLVHVQVFPITTLTTLGLQKRPTRWTARAVEAKSWWRLICRTPTRSKGFGSTSHRFTTTPWAKRTRSKSEGRTTRIPVSQAANW